MSLQRFLSIFVTPSLFRFFLFLSQFHSLCVLSTKWSNILAEVFASCSQNSCINFSNFDGKFVSCCSLFTLHFVCFLCGNFHLTLDSCCLYFRAHTFCAWLLIEYVFNFLYVNFLNALEENLFSFCMLRCKSGQFFANILLSLSLLLSISIGYCYMQCMNFVKCILCERFLCCHRCHRRQQRRRHRCRCRLNYFVILYTLHLSHFMQWCSCSLRFARVLSLVCVFFFAGCFSSSAANFFSILFAVVCVVFVHRAVVVDKPVLDVRYSFNFTSLWFSMHVLYAFSTLCVTHFFPIPT